MSGTTGLRVVIVGASVAGLAVAEGLRRAGHTGELTLIDREPNALYDRPPLSKQFLAGEWDHDRLALRTPDALEALHARWILGDAARRLDVDELTIRLNSGALVEADAVVIATGMRARPLDGAAAGVHTLRNLEDARRLREQLRPGGRLAVIGNGVLGSEIASTAVGRGADVTLVGPDALPMLSVLGPLGAKELARRHANAGVRLVGGRRASVVTDARVVRLDDDSEISADVVVVAIGGIPDTEWLEISGLALHDGVVCDAWSRAAPGIWAVGDVARFEHLVHGLPVRLDNRTNAVEQGLSVAKDILGVGAPYVPVPYFWSDQYGTRIQVYGEIRPDDDVDLTEGDVDAGRFTAAARRDGELTGILGWGMPKQARLQALELFARAQHVRDSTIRTAGLHERS